MWDPKWFTSAHARLNANYSRHLAWAAVSAVACTGLGAVLSPPYIAAPTTIPEAPMTVIELEGEVVIPPRAREIPMPVFWGEIDPLADGIEVETLPLQPIDWPWNLRPAAPAAPRDFVARPEVPPTLVHAPPPVYSEIAQRMEAAGQVLLELLIDVDGRVVSVKIVESQANELLERAAMDAARQFLFAPAMQGDTPVRSRVVVPFDFHLGG